MSQDQKDDSPVRGLAGLIAANVSLIIAIMVYMGWAYDSAYYGQFHLNPLDLGLSVEDYLLYSVDLFKPAVVLVAVAVIAVVGATRSDPSVKASPLPLRERVTRLRTAHHRPHWLERLYPQDTAKHRPKSTHPERPQVLVGALGTAVMAGGLILYRVASYVPVNTYLVLALLASGPLLLTWSLRSQQHKRGLRSWAIVVCAVCALWAGSLYAHGLGTQAAQQFVANLDTKTQVAVYSVQPLALSGPGLQVKQFPSKYQYHYRYTGLRLLYMSSDTYYVLPSEWTQESGQTYIFDPADQSLRIEFY